MVQRNKPCLHIGASAHLLGAAHQDAHGTVSDFSKQFSLFCFGVCIVDELDLLFRDAFGDQLVAHIVVYVKAVLLGCAEVTENHLGGALLLGLFPYLIYLIHTGVGLAAGVVR